VDPLGSGKGLIFSCKYGDEPADFGATELVVCYELESLFVPITHSTRR
jgi:hypothetical protein